MARKPIKPTRKREPLPIIYVELPTCLECDGAEFEIDGTIQQGDGSKLQYAECKQCGHRQKIVWEIPLCGMDS